MSQREKELEDSLRGIYRIVKAFSYTNTLGPNQLARIKVAEKLLEIKI